MASELSRLSGYYDRKTANDMDYREYMGKQAMVKDIGTAIQRSTDQQMIMTAMTGIKISDRIDQSAERLENSMVRMQTGIQTSIKAQTLAIVASQAALAYTFNKGFDKINNTLDMGFAGVSDQLGAMTASFSMGFASLEKNLEKMNKDICDRLDALHDIMNNPLLTQSRELYRRAVTNYNKGFFEEALEDIKSAVEKNKTDYISWFHQGKVYLFGASEFSNVIDLDKAIEALTQAAKYNKPDITESDDARLMASEIYFYLGLASYSKSNDLLREKKGTEAAEILIKARQYFEQSYSYSNKMLEAYFNIARCLILLGDKTSAYEYLKNLLWWDRNYCLKVYSDNDFLPVQEEFTALIKRIKLSTIKEATPVINNIKKLMDELVSLGGTLQVKIPSVDSSTEEMPFFDLMDYFDKRGLENISSQIQTAIEERKRILEKEKQEKMEKESAINQIKADVERISYLSKEKELLDDEDWRFDHSIREKYFLAGIIPKNDIATIIRTYDAGKVHKKSMAEDEAYAESVRTMNEAGKLIGRSYNPSGLREYESEPLRDEKPVDTFSLQHILSLSETDFIHCVNNLYAKEHYEGDGRNRIVLKPETIKRLKVLRENKELANRLIEVIETAFEKWSQNLNKEREREQKKNMRVAIIVLGVIIAIIVAIIIKCVA